MKMADLLKLDIH